MKYSALGMFAIASCLVLSWGMGEEAIARFRPQGESPFFAQTLIPSCNPQSNVGRASRPPRQDACTTVLRFRTRLGINGEAIRTVSGVNKALEPIRKIGFRALKPQMDTDEHRYLVEDKDFLDRFVEERQFFRGCLGRVGLCSPRREGLGYFENISQVLTPTPPSQSRTCPADVETLTARMLRDLPSYANRVIQRSRRVDRATTYFPLYVILAGRPEFAPLSIGSGQYNSPEASAAVEQPTQVFITTLERQYSDGKVVEFQNYHWLFLTYTQGSWWLALIYSRLGFYPEVGPPTPPRESSNGIIGQAIRLWLRDCRAGAVRSR